MPTILIHNAETGEIIEREMNSAEVNKWEADIATEQARAKTKAEAEAAKASLLQRLGITEEEAKLLLG